MLLRMEEDTCTDAETGHSSAEVIGYFAADHPGQIVGDLVECLHHGDVDFSGSLTAGDAQTVFHFVLGLLTPTFEQACAADCNGNGSITAGDAQEIFSAVLGIGACVDPI
ncbi:dockerin type I repeat-containing protein [bacterium]|nr:dockerin type I repeat-containing protein [bacterium]